MRNDEERKEIVDNYSLERRDLDDINRRNTNKNSYRSRKFNGNRSVHDEYSGETIYISSKGQFNTSGKRHYSTERTANVDHVVPIERIINTRGEVVTKGKLTKKELREIANSDYNLALTGERRNKSKGQKSNHQYLYDQLKEGNPESFRTTVKMLNREITSEVAITYNVKAKVVSKKLVEAKVIQKREADFAVQSTSNAMASGTNAAFMSLIVSSMSNIVQVATNEKSVDEAVKSVVKDTGGSFISAAGADIIQRVIAQCAENSQNEMIKHVLAKDLPIQEIATAVMIGNSVIRFINDEISMEECATEILLNGAGAMAYSFGMSIGGPAGAIAATIVMSQINRVAIEYQKAVKVRERQAKRLRQLTAEALVEMEKQRRKLKAYIDTEQIIFDTNIDNGFETIFHAALNNDEEGIAKGLNQILINVNQTVQFSNMADFDSFFFNGDAVFVL